VARLRYKKPKSSSFSTTPAIYPERKTIKALNDLKSKIPQRIEKGELFFLLEMAQILRKRIQDTAPDVQVGENMIDYAKDLKIAIAAGWQDVGPVCVYFENAEVELTVDRLGETALFFRRTSASPEWVDVLIKYGPWPAEMVPVEVKNTDAKIIARKARPDELQALANRIYFRRQEIEGLLARAGAKNPRVEITENGVGVVVKEDVGYNVLRKEFGFDGEKQEAHWRPALRMLREEAKMVWKKFDRYVMNGRANIFDLPDNYGEISKTKFSEGEPFQKELAPFS